MAAGSQTMNIALPKELVERMDEVAKKEYRNRSELIREAVRVYIERQSRWEDLFDYGRTRAEELGINNEADLEAIIGEYRAEQAGKASSSG